MPEQLKQNANMTLTENGAVTYASTGSDCLDLFATIGALRHASDREILDRFIRAYTEDADLAMKTLFFARDVRGGLGERRVFKTILRWLANNKPDSVRKNVQYVAGFGRYDDLLVLMGTRCEKDAMDVIKKQLDEDLACLDAKKPISLLGKWLPSVNASDENTVKCAKHIAGFLGMSDAQYRKTLTTLRAELRIIENNLRERDYTFDYAKQPSRAMFKYRQAFFRNDKERYLDFMNSVSNGEAMMHADNVSPYELVESCLRDFRWHIGYCVKELSESEEKALNVTWDSLPDYGGNGNILAVIDTSGSMYSCFNPMPASVALSLGLYFAGRNTGIFRNHFIEFSARPQLIELKGETFTDQLRYVASFNEVANTNLEAVFDMILDTAVKNKVSQEELPAKLVIISDMEFDECVENAGLSNFENAKKKYETYGYTLPEIVFWNVESRNRQQPVTMNEQGVALVSGVTPRLFAMVAGGTLSPYAFMTDTLYNERYACITA